MSKQTSILRVLMAVVVSLTLIASSCGGDDDVTSTNETTATDTSTTTTSGDGTTSSETTEGGDTTTSGDGTTSSETTEGGETTTTLPGEPWEGFAQEGDVMAVMGVAYNDTLNVRQIPGGEVMTTLGPTATDLVATGQARRLPRSYWYEVTANDVTGWVSLNYVAFIGGTDDVTAEFLDGNPPPETATMVELADLVAAEFASDDPPSTIVQTVAPSVGDLAEITYDIVGLGDDAVAGLRLHIFATPSDEGFVLKSIERTGLCLRGSYNGGCV